MKNFEHEAKVQENQQTEITKLQLGLPLTGIEDKYKDDNTSVVARRMRKLK